MEECSVCAAKQGLDQVTHHQNTALPKRELSEAARLQSYIIPFSGGLLPSDVSERALGPTTLQQVTAAPKAV